MTILFAGGEDTSFTIYGGVQWGTGPGSGGNRPAFSRLAAEIQQSTAVDPPTMRIQTPAFTPSAAIWIHGWVFNGDAAGNNFTVNQQVALARSPDGVSRVLLRATTTRNLLKLSTRNAAGTITDVATATTIIPINVLAQIDWLINFSTGSTLYVNGAAALTYAGDLRTDAATALNQIDISGMNYNFWGDYWSEIIVADTDTRSMGLWTLPPAAAGNAQSWTPNTLGNINKTAINDSTFISTTANTALTEWTTLTAPPSGTWTVQAIVQNARVQVSTTGPQHFDFVARTASTDFLAGAPQAPSLAFSNFQHIWPVNPNTGLPWQITDIAAGFNLGIESQA
jgi:hypothetical protein